MLLQHMIWSQPFYKNLRLNLSDGEYEGSTPLLSNVKIALSGLDLDTCIEIIKFANYLGQEKMMMVIVPEDIIEQSFLSNPTDNGIIDHVEDTVILL